MEENQNNLQDNEQTTVNEQPTQSSAAEQPTQEPSAQSEQSQAQNSAWQQNPPIPPTQQGSVNHNSINQPPYTPPQSVNRAYQGPQQYSPQMYTAQPQKNQSGYAVASLILGICGLSFFVCGFGIICGIVGLILGIVSLAKKYDNKGMAVAGIILSALSVILTFALIIVYIAAIAVDSTLFLP